MRSALAAAVTLWLAGSACTPEVNRSTDLRQASGRARLQTAPHAIAVYPGDVAEPYDVLGDVEVILRQRGAFGMVPTTEDGLRAMKEQAGRLGAHAIILVSFGNPGISVWSYQELRGHGRAIRFR